MKLSELKDLPPSIFSQLDRIKCVHRLLGSYRCANFTAWNWFRRENGAYVFEVDVPTMERNLPKTVRKHPHHLFTIDIEHWSLARSFGEALDGYLNLRRAISDAAEIVRGPLGFYRLLPTRQYPGTINTEERIRQWKLRNDHSMDRLGDMVSYLAPSLYYIGNQLNSVDEWKVFAQANLNEARRMTAGMEMPILAFISPRVYPMNTNDVLSYDLMKGMIDFLLDDNEVHVIIWDKDNDWVDGHNALKAIEDALEERT